MPVLNFDDILSPNASSGVLTFDDILPSDSGMPTGRKLAPQVAARASPQALAPRTDVGGLKGVGEAALALGRGAVKGTFGAPGDIAQVLSDYSPATLLGITPKGLNTLFPTSEKVGEMFNLGQTPAEYAPYEFIGSVFGPGGIAKGVNVGGKA